MTFPQLLVAGGLTAFVAGFMAIVGVIICDTFKGKLRALMLVMLGTVACVESGLLLLLWGIA